MECVGYSVSTSELNLPPCWKFRLFVWIYLFVLTRVTIVVGEGEIIYAINAGGEAHIDMYGIQYQRDPLHGKIGIASDYGKNVFIGRIPQPDQSLYQTERYHYTTFGYDIPVKGDGEYILTLKFCEVYFTSPNQKVFDVVLNHEHVVISDLDIYEKVGHGVAHDEYISFSVQNGKLNYHGDESEIRNGKIRIEFVKGYRDNPKINALYLMKGTLDDIPKLPPLPEPETEDYDYEEKKASKPRRSSGPKVADPYSEDETSVMLPVFVAIGAFVPILFCLCKL